MATSLLTLEAALAAAGVWYEPQIGAYLSSQGHFLGFTREQAAENANVLSNTAGGSTSSYEPAAVVPPAATPATTTSAGLLDQYKAILTPEQYQQLVAPLQYTAAEHFGGNVQDYQVQLVTPLDTSKVGVPKKLALTADGTPATPNVTGDSQSGYQSSEPVTVNGVPVFAQYDASGNLTGYVGDNRVTTWTSNKDRLIGNWDASGNPAPVTSTSSGGGLFGTGIGSNFSWNDLRDNLLAAGVVAGNYVLPGSSLLTGQLVTQGAQENLNTDAGKLANLAAGAAGGIAGNTANYGAIADAAGVTTAAPAAGAAGAGADASFIAADAAQLAQQGLSQAAIEQNLVAAGVDAFTAADAAQLALQGIKGTQLEGLLTQSSGGNPLFTGAGAATGSTTSTGAANPLSSLTPAQVASLAKAGISVAGLLGGTAALGGLLGGGSDMVTLPAQNRAGVSSGSAQYSPEYYQAIQAKYNQMMPQQPRDVTTDLKNWYETKYAPSVNTTPKVA